MATGDRIGIADKSTLDLVRSDTNSLRSSITTVHNKLDALTTNNIVEDVILPSQVSRFSQYNGAFNGTTGTILNLNTPGILYYLVFPTSNLANVRMVITADDIKVFDVNFTLNSTVTYNGISCEKYVRYHPSATNSMTIHSVGGQGVLPLSSKVFNANNTTMSAGNLILPSPLRFNSKLSAVITTSAAVSFTYYYCYKLD